MDAKKLIELRKQAEKAVEDMQDGEFKLKAFEVILNHLLSPGKTEPMPGKTRDAKTQQEKYEPMDMDSESTGGRIMVLKDEGFMKSPKTISEVRGELQAHGWHYPVTTLSGELIKLVQKRKLRRQRVKVGNKLIWQYSNP
ncbi:MAG: hypothetical protein FJ025_05495 [Chloroflexi bacterium]|nr:hypothetical protein [Chloroflexota bacterium]